MTQGLPPRPHLFVSADASRRNALRKCPRDESIASKIGRNYPVGVACRSIIFAQPKSARSRRTIALSPSAIITLRDHHEKQSLNRVMLGMSLTDDDLVFSRLDGKALRPNIITRAWNMLAGRAGVKVIRLHDGRHTHASLMLKQGIHPKIVQERLGHSSIEMTLDIYSHVAPGLPEAAVRAFDSLLRGSHNSSAAVSVRNGE